jgi:VanZ family protein
MQGLIRALALVYLILVTLLLLSPDPAKLVPYQSVWAIVAWLAPWAHFLAFFSLTLLALAPRWPAPRWAVVLILALYAGGTELAQKMSPTRAAEWKDWFQDLGGVALGAVVCWLAFLLTDAFVRAWRRRHPVDAPSEHWRVLRNIIDRKSVV